MKRLPFILLAVVILVLVAATVVEHVTGSGAVVYGSWWFVALWAALLVAAVCYMLRRKLQRRPVVFLLHMALGLILVGAFVTRVWGVQGSVHLRPDADVASFSSADGTTHALPFSLQLVDFDVENYPGTQSPMDYVSVVRAEGEEMRISMNHIGEHRHYRFYQSGYDEDMRGTTLAVSHDPVGIGITYVGYALLFLSMFLLLVLPGEGFRRALRRLAVMAIVVVTQVHGAAAAPKTLPEVEAAQFGSLYCYYNGRICPVQTVARHFTTKLYGKPSYRGLTAEQVFTGWIFYPTTWLDQPVIKLKGEAAKAIGIDGKYAAYADFFASGSYELDSRLHEGNRAILEANEKMSIIRMLLSGQLLKIYPVAVTAPDVENEENEKMRNGEMEISSDSSHLSPLTSHLSSLSPLTSHLVWYSQGDNLPLGIPDDQYFFIKKSMDYVGELVVQRDYTRYSETLEKIRKYQRQQAADVLPSDAHFRAERLYNSADLTRPLFMLLATLGIVFFFVYVRFWLMGRDVPHLLVVVLNVVLVSVMAYLTFFIGLRGYVAGHLPLSNGYETMQFMSLSVLVLTLLLQRRFVLVMPFGLLLGGLTLLVSTLGASNPQITPLMPVLSSPLLSVHVCVIMVAYSLLAFTMLNGITALVVREPSRVEHLARISHMLLYPALFLLTAGIFIGAIWANVSWGRYWGWDPKETWALITMLVYSIPLHGESLPWLRRPRAFHIYMVAAFLTVLMTYFGVNFILGGMHSYANA